MLRIISGTAGGIRIKTPDTEKTRPTLDRVKESVFSILQPYIPDSRVLDLFAGSGSLGLEALSRGASHCVFVDGSRNCRAIINENILRTHMSGKAQVMQADVFKAISALSGEGSRFDMIFMDPPYCHNYVNKTLQMIDENDIINENGIVAVEHHEDEQPAETVGRLDRIKFRSYGDTCFSFYVRRPEDS
jgi:16S rRNA (guanine966-N2)-methyltransferase